MGYVLLCLLEAQNLYLDRAKWHAPCACTVYPPHKVQLGCGSTLSHGTVCNVYVCTWTPEMSRLSYCTSTQCQHHVTVHEVTHTYVSTCGSILCAARPVLLMLLYNIVMHYLYNHISPMTYTNILMLININEFVGHRLAYPMYLT